MLNILPVLKSGCSAQSVVIRAWTCGVGGTISASTAASALLLCTSEIRNLHFNVCWLRHWSGQAVEREPSTVLTTGSGADPTRLVNFMPMSTAAVALTGEPDSNNLDPQARHQQLKPVTDISADRLAKLADELHGIDGVVGRQSRCNRPPQRTVAEDGPLADASTSEGGSGLSDDAEVKAVFDKLVGNLTKSGKKSLARRIVLDAVRVMQGHLRRADLDKIK